MRPQTFNLRAGPYPMGHVCSYEAHVLSRLRAISFTPNFTPLPPSLTFAAEWGPGQAISPS